MEAKKLIGRKYIEYDKEEEVEFEYTISNVSSYVSNGNIVNVIETTGNALLYLINGEFESFLDGHKLSDENHEYHLVND